MGMRKAHLPALVGIILVGAVGVLNAAQSLVIQRATVIDATGKPPQPDMTVIVEGDRIVAVSPWKKAKVAKEAQVLEGKGKFLIPGLWDMHVHGATAAGPNSPYPLYLANGVVGVREMWGPANAKGWRAKLASHDKPVPHIFLASPIVDGPKPI